jgi:hypothetical protein
MTSPAEDCWRLSKDCGQWAVESRDGAARLAFRQMAAAWARLAFNEEFYEHMTLATTDKTPDLSWRHIRLSLRSRISFPKR